MLSLLIDIEHGIIRTPLNVVNIRCRDSISDPVVPVGHSYGGATITNAAVGSTNVKASCTSPLSSPTRASNSAR
ncbi:hypothetical protein ACFWBF_15540 [Streptomyces sp. NPDC060028]|uniref:hypothetical protein n=1 Tax=Streptomyces sp. NPDC060028 TaxID=3347041 RepID=UPI0036C7B3D3